VQGPAEEKKQEQVVEENQVKGGGQMTMFTDDVSNYQAVEGLLAADFAGVECHVTVLDEK